MRKTLMLAIVSIVTLSLAACGPDDGSVKGTDCIELDANLDQCTVTLPDTRRVTCITHSNGGVDCDWAHADGSDNLCPGCAEKEVLK